MKLKYIGDLPEVLVPHQGTGKNFVFKNGEPREVPLDLAKALLFQPDKFSTAEDVAEPKEE